MPRTENYNFSPCPPLLYLWATETLSVEIRTRNYCITVEHKILNQRLFSKISWQHLIVLIKSDLDFDCEHCKCGGLHAYICTPAPFISPFPGACSNFIFPNALLLQRISWNLNCKLSLLPSFFLILNLIFKSSEHGDPSILPVAWPFALG